MEKVFWSNYPEGPFWLHPENFDKSGSRMYAEGEFVIYEYSHYDHEDRRRYDYSGKFKLEDYKRALIEARERGRSVLNSKGGELRIVLEGEFFILSFSGSPGSSPGGRMIHGTVPEGRHRILDIF